MMEVITYYLTVQLKSLEYNSTYVNRDHYHDGSDITNRVLTDNHE